MNARFEQLLKLYDEGAKDSFILFALAKEYEKMGDLEQSLLFYKRLRSQDPAYTGLYYHLGKLYEALEQTAEALEAYDAGMVVAKTQGDQHAFSELSGARLNLEYDV